MVKCRIHAVPTGAVSALDLASVDRQSVFKTPPPQSANCNLRVKKNVLQSPISYRNSFAFSRLPTNIEYAITVSAVAVFMRMGRFASGSTVKLPRQNPSVRLCQGRGIFRFLQYIQRNVRGFQTLFLP